MESPRVFGIIAASAKPNEWFLYQLLAPIAAAIAWSMSLAGSFLTINPANDQAHPPPEAQRPKRGTSEGNEAVGGRVQRLVLSLLGRCSRLSI